MKTYHILWEISIDAENPEGAAREALEIQRDPASTATVFCVTGDGEGPEDIDLDEIDQEKGETA